MLKQLKSAVVGIPAATLVLAHEAYAAVPADVTTAMTDMKADGVTVATAFLVASIVTSCNANGANGCNVRCNSVSFQTGSAGDAVVVMPLLALGTSCSYTGTLSGPENSGGEVPIPAGCMVVSAHRGNPDKCRCVDQRGNDYPTKEGICRQIVKSGYFFDFIPSPHQNTPTDIAPDAPGRAGGSVPVVVPQSLPVPAEVPVPAV